MGKIIFCGDFNSRISNLVRFMPIYEQDPNFDLLYESSQHATPECPNIMILALLVEN